VKRFITTESDSIRCLRRNSINLTNAQVSSLRRFRDNGFGFPAAIGAQFACPKKIVLISPETIVPDEYSGVDYGRKNRLPVKVAILITAF